MPRHSKNVNTNAQFGYNERKKANATGYGNLTKRLGSKSALPFGFCSLSLVPTENDAVASPSGHIYKKEAILEYLLHHRKKIAEEERAALEQGERLEVAEKTAAESKKQEEQDKFKALVDSAGVGAADTSDRKRKRERDIDDSSNTERIIALKKSSPWLASFTPCADTVEKVVAKKGNKTQRAPSPCSGMPLRASDLIPLNLQSDKTNKEGKSYVCSVSGKVITTQQVVCIKNTHAVMLEEVAKTLAYPTSTCPITGEKFVAAKHVLKLQKAQSAFAESGTVEATLKRQAAQV